MNEVSLKDIILILWKQKWLIVIVTAIFIVFGLVYCILIPRDSYKAEAVLMIQPTQDSVGIADMNTVTEIVESLAENPALSLESYIAQIKLSPVLEEVADVLGIDKSNENYLKALRNKISIISPENSNLIYINYKDKDGEKAIIGVNAIADSYINYVSETMKLQAKTAIDFISVQLEVENVNVDNAMQNLTVFLSQPRGVNELQGELDSSMVRIDSYKSQLSDLEIDIVYYEEGLKAAKNQIEKTPEFFTVLKVVGDEAELTAALISEGGAELSEVANMTMIEQIPNEAYIELAKTINNYEIMTKMDIAKATALMNTLKHLQVDIESLQAELAMKKSESESLYENVNNAKTSKELYQTELKTAETKLVVDIGEKSVTKIAGAQNYESTGISSVYIMILAALFGVVISVILSIIVYSWKSDGRPRQENDNRVNES